MPIGSMYGIFTYIWLIFMVNVGKYTIHGWYGMGFPTKNDQNLGCEMGVPPFTETPI